jgi:hypothetical protein
VVSGHWSLVIGHWSLVIGHWSSGQWSVVEWSVVEWSVVSGQWVIVKGFLLTTDNGQRTTNNCTGEAFGELFLAMTDNLSSKCFAPTNNEQLTTDN